MANIEEVSATRGFRTAMYTKLLPPDIAAVWQTKGPKGGQSGSPINTFIGSGNWPFALHRKSDTAIISANYIILSKTMKTECHRAS